ncbi:MAG: bifunctional diaminohydroxyphosphoribosylaminopyrimidine deaminase/5-amino-6-(5-phosphoribosylamino)uracil reductase RibD [Candidatus Woesearchaeota archaeon]|jgi:diaminohydroxyphosphoribosylaminopyrimidine deaminase/5-amino-6-(5-phosphoribosylamino)uracil reductase
MNKEKDVQTKDIQYMNRAIVLAQQAYPAPNPQVGAVLVKNEKIIAEGFHHAPGEPHAEIMALKDAEKKGILADGATLYVTLEPCCHFGKTPPCIDAIIVAGIKRVVIGCIDQNSLVNGAGVSGFVQAGVTVNIGICGKECETMYNNFFHVQKTKRPYITLKSAITIDGKITTEPRKQTQISSKESQYKVHELRKNHDGILVGIGTVLSDNPQLNCRIPCTKQPRPIILDSKLKIPIDAKVLKNKPIIITGKMYDKKKYEILKKKAQIIVTSDEKVILEQALQKLPDYGILSILVEGGSEINALFFQKKIIDRVCFFIAPKLFGTGVPMFATMKETKQPMLNNVNYTLIGTDVYIEAEVHWQQNI